MAMHLRRRKVCVMWSGKHMAEALVKGSSQRHGHIPGQSVLSFATHVRAEIFSQQLAAHITYSSFYSSGAVIRTTFGRFS